MEEARITSLPTDTAQVIDLVKRAMNGDEMAFGELYNLYLPPVYGYVYRMVGTRTEAEDMTQDVFFKAWRAMPRYQFRGAPFSSWLFRIAHNHCVDFLRRRKPFVPLREETLEAVTEGDSLERTMERAEIASALARLNPSHRQVIILKFFHGLDGREVAAIMGKSEGAIRVLQLRALQALGRLLDKGGG